MRSVCACGHSSALHARASSLDGPCSFTRCICRAFSLAAQGPPCLLCTGSGWASNAYLRQADCPRCAGCGIEPTEPQLHVGMLLRSRRSGKVWAVFHRYEDGRWGIHRMKVSVRGGHYVWQIQMRENAQLGNTRAWTPAGVGDAWDHEAMETDPT
jgi:hypothetical protein